MLSCFRGLMAVIRKLFRYGKNDRSVDHLSFCPCLVEILQMVDRADVFSCRLVNHRLNGVIRKNRATMPKEKVKLGIVGYKAAGEPHLLVQVISDVRRVYGLTDRHISIWKSRGPGIPSVDEYFAMSGVPVEISDIEKDESLSKINLRMETANEEYAGNESLKNGKAKCYQLKGINEGLRPLVRLIFGRYSFSELNIRVHPSFPETCVNQWLRVFGEEFGRSHATCTLFTTDVCYPCMFDFLVITATTGLELCFKGDTSDIIPVLRLDRVKEIYIYCYINTVTAIVDLIRDMQVNVQLPSFIRIINVTHDSSRWSYQPMLAALSQLKDVSIGRKSKFWQYLSAKIRRPVDGKVITMKYFYDQITISCK